MIAGISRGELYPYARLIISISNWLYFQALATISYLWLAYVSIKIEGPSVSVKRLWLMAVPFLLYTAVALSNAATGFLFTVDANNLYLRGRGIVFHWVLTWGYLLTATVRTVLAYRKEKNKIRRQEIRPMILFAIAPTLASILQMRFYGVSSAQAGVTVSIMMISLAAQNSHIITDPLTQLNNRRSLEAYFNRHLERYGEKPLMLMMIDIDEFKKINDRFGHIVGDRVLIEVATELQRLCREAADYFFLCRYGGDEFFIAGAGIDRESVHALTRSIHDAMKSLENKKALPCAIGVCVGYACDVCKTDKDIERLLKRADQSMYAEKLKRKQRKSSLAR